MLTEKILNYQKTEMGWSEIYDRVSILIYNFPTTISKKNEDHCGDFFLYCHKHINNYVKNFEYKQIPFENYLNYCLKFQYISFLKHKTKKDKQNQLVSNTQYLDRASSPAELFMMDTFIDNFEKYLIQQEQISQKQLLILLLKTFPYLDAAILENIFYNLTLSYNQTHEYIEKAVKICEPKYKRYNVMCEKRNSVYSDIKILEDKLLLVSKSEENHKIMLKISKKKTQLDNLNKRIQNIRIVPSNRDLSEILQIPKGTVDSIINKLRKKQNLE